jgi:hypothetical protein
LFVDPVDVKTVIKDMQLPDDSVMMLDDVTWEMWLPKTGLPVVKQNKYYPCTLKNDGASVSVHINGHNIGNLSEACLPEAV